MIRRPPRSTLFPTRRSSDLGFSHEENLADAERLADLLAALNGCPVPTLARVHGAALGGGVGLLAGCDIVVAARSEEHTSELKSRQYIVCRLLLEKKEQNI